MTFLIKLGPKAIPTGTQSNYTCLFILFFFFGQIVYSFFEGAYLASEQNL